MDLGSSSHCPSFSVLYFLTDFCIKKIKVLELQAVFDSFPKNYLKLQSDHFHGSQRARGFDDTWVAKGILVGLFSLNWSTAEGGSVDHCCEGGGKDHVCCLWLDLLFFTNYTIQCNNSNKSQSIFEEGTYLINLIQHLLLFLVTLWGPRHAKQDNYKDKWNKESFILEHEILHIFTGLRVCLLKKTIHYRFL